MLTRVHRLGHYVELAPPPSLQSVASAVWTYHAPESGGAEHRVLPDSGVSLCFFSRAGLAEADVAIIGPVETPRVFTPPAGLHLDAVRLKPEWCRGLLNVDPAEHVDAVTIVRAPRLLDRLARAADVLTVLLAEVEELLAAARVSAGARVAHEALERIRSTDGSVIGLGALAKSVRVNERRLRRAVVAETGFSPKHLHRVQRLNRAVAAADRAARPEWSRIALDAGYYDQPHLIAEMRALTGLAPRELHRERIAENEARPISPRS
jgi:AraC-like DNA-binding protein